MYMSGFGKNSGPSGPPRPHTPFGSSLSPPFPSPTPSSNPNPNPNPNPNLLDKRSPSSIAAASTPQLPWLPQTPPQRGMIAISPQRWDIQPKQPSSHAYSTNNQWISPSISSAIAHDSEPMYAKRTRSPPLPSPEDSPLGDLSSNSGSRLGTHPEKHSENGSDGPVKRMKSPLLVFESSQSAQNHGVAHGHAQRPDISPPRSGNQRITPFQDVDNPPRQRLFGLQSHAPSHDSGAISPPKAQYFDAPKRARSPPLRTSDGSMGTMSVQLDSEREMQAKAKRLSRFNVELSQPILDQHDPMIYKFTGSRHNQALVSKVNTINHTDVAHSLGMGDSLSDYEGLGSNAVVVGVCPDMCPESEREERERKGDLDKYERLDGDRNQTNKFLAVKKYNRTAERDAELIRPMPILLKTIGYLLNLLDQPYGDDFLGIYNFLWDRMRAIRMDLRMQHMFNEEAITMLEQMIRLHIIAMHELCEYQKGEGFSEGFDAHLNIEQMNKTSVELFQMYDDHRNKGKSVPTEKEFRGYYALLKLDRHPGYKVEPAELSLDLAKMTPEIRCTPEIMFARDVARACRTGNYISFFRLARKATYLQACLMHAHFAKLRTQALASLHSGLQSNQGIPVEHVVNWLAMEGEDIESLLEYHGFMIKKYEEMYMVKEGPFLNSDIEFPTKCSQLVHLKKSKTIIDDVYSGHSFSSVCEERETAQDIVEMVNQDSVVSGTESWVNTIDEEMLDDKVETDPTTTIKSQPLLGEPSPAILNSKSEGDLQKVSFVGASSPSLDDIIINPTHTGEKVVELDEVVPTDETPLLKLSGSIFQAGTPGKANSNHIENLEPQRALGKSVQNELLMIVHHKNDEVTREKHKQILRKWKQQSSKLREIREHRMFLANAALSSLSLGPPIQRSEDQLRCPTSMLNIEFIARKRHGKQGKFWARLNVSELVASILSARNPDSKCISWKLVVCANPTETDSKEYHLASKWLQSKLLGSVKENDGELLVPSSGISIWKKWIDTTSSPLQSCCLSIIRMFDINQPITEDTVAGLSCLLFVVSGIIPWEIQRVQLHNFLKSIPSGSSLPLLIVSSDLHKEESTNPSSTIIDGLDLLGVEKTKIKSYKVVFLTGDGQQEAFNVFFDDDQLREGLMWLANNSPPQPSLHLMKTRELVLRNLRHSLDVLDNLHIRDVGPHHCISAFNEALDRSVEEVLAAASANPSHWPCPEINLLENSSSERMVSCMFLPSIGWSSATKVELVARALEGCKLPSFSDDISWLNQGCRMGEEIQNQKLALQECIIRYMTQYSQLLDMDLAVREANIMLQKGAALDLRGSCYHIVPRWVMIFRRIFNWQLMRLTSGECSFAYILEQKDEPCAGDSFSSSNVIQPLNSVVGVKDLEDYSGSVQQPSGHSLVPEISLDEMVEINCSIPFLQQPQQAHSPVCTLSLVRESIHVRSKISGDVHDPQINSSGDHLLETNNLSDEANDKDLRCKAAVSDAFEHGRRNEERMSPLSKKDDRLSKLLDQCKRLQDMIDEKLAIYF